MKKQVESFENIAQSMDIGVDYVSGDMLIHIVNGRLV